MERQNCWEVKKCGREPGGAAEAQLGSCPAAIDASADGFNGGRRGGRICWSMTGTLCGGVCQGTFAQKRHACTSCDFFLDVKQQEGEDFRLLLDTQSFEKVLLSIEDRYLALFNGVRVGLYRIRPSGELLDVNPAMIQMLGFPNREALLAADAASLSLAAEDNLSWPERIERAGDGRSFEVQIRRRDGSTIWVRNNASVVRNEAGDVIYYSGVIEDVTEHKEMEALRAAKEAAEAANRAKGGFLACMSHEIRTPMNGVIGMTGLLLDTDLSAQQREYADLILRSADALLYIINDILDFSKIEAGGMTLESLPFDLEVVIQETVEMLRARSEEAGIELILRYAPGAPQHLVGDPGRIRQIIFNLVGNAVKFTPTGYVFINVEGREDADGMAEMRVSVEDTGIGIPASRLDQVFDRFTQADTSTTRRYGGTGLGLAISKQLVELMGGTIGVSSVDGQGSAFHFEVRLPGPTEAPSASADGADLTGMRVLVVDDIKINRRILQEQVTKWGMRATCCESGVGGLAALKQASDEGDPFDLAILDYQMPGQDGEMLARAIKAEPTISKTVLIILSSLGQRRSALDPEATGIAAWLAKPVKSAELRDTLYRVWGRCSRKELDPPNAVPAPQTVARSSESPVGRADFEGVRVRVLLVDDNRINQRVATLILERLNCQVDLASDGEEAVKMARTLPYDLIFMDCEMPSMDGYAAAAMIRQGEGPKRRVPIVALTAHVMTQQRDRCLESGMDGFVSKPVRPLELAAALRRHTPQPMAADVTDQAA